MKRVLNIIFIPLLIIVLLFVILQNFIQPRIETWLTKQIPLLFAEQKIGELKIDEIHFSFTNPVLSLKHIQWTPKESMQYLNPVHIDQVTANIDFFNLLAGRIGVKEVQIQNFSGEINLDAIPESPEEPLALKKLFFWLPKIPIEKISFIESNFNVLAPKKHLSLQIQATEAFLQNKSNALVLSTTKPIWIASHYKKFQENFSLSLEANLTKEEMELEALKLTSHLVNAQISGVFKNPSHILLEPHGKLRIQVDLTTDKIQDYALEIAEIRLPSIKGSVHTEGDISFKGLEKYDSQFKINLAQIKIDQFTLGDARLTGEMKNKLIKVSNLSLQHPSGEAELKNLIVDLTEQSLKGEVLIEKFDLQKLFSSLQLNHIPVHTQIHGGFKVCELKLHPELNLNCDGELFGKNLRVQSGMDPKSKKIVELSEYGAKGFFVLDKNQIQYKSQVSIKNSLGQSDGVIHFKNGFKINFSTPSLNAKNVDDLAGIPIEGDLKLVGQTEGNSSRATLQTQLSGEKVWVQDFYLGQVSTQLSLEKGLLKFLSLAGQAGVSRYQGDLIIDLNQSSLDGNFRIPYVEIPDITQIMSRKFTMPVEVKGVGQAEAHIWGPFDFSRLSYDLKSNFTQGYVLGESFQKMSVNFISRDGEVRTEKTFLQKGQSIITLTGQAWPDGKVDARIQGDKIKLQESENLNRLNSNIFGNLNFRMSFNGPILSPDTILKGEVTQLAVGDQDIEDSQFTLNLKKDSVEGNIKLIGDKISGFFMWPYEKTGPFRMNLDLKQWDFTAMLSTLTGGAVQNDFTSNLTGKVDLIAERGGFWKSTGRVSIDEIQIQRDHLSIKNHSPMEARFMDGVITLNDFKLEGPGQLIEISGERFSENNLEVLIKARTDLRLLQLLTPFLEDIGGRVDLTAQLQGSLIKPEILGQLRAQDAYLKIKGIPHPIEKLTAEVSFSHSKILISTLAGQIAGGTITGDGEIKIEGLSKLPTQIHARVENVNLNFPDQIRTSGNADLALTGSWFPFTLSGTYNVLSGMVTKDFSKGGSVGSSRLSSYLPKMILQEAFEPIVLDLQINLDKSIQIKNPLMEGALSGQLQVKGPTHSPILLGMLQAKPNGKLIVNEKIFEINSLILQFKNPQAINPELFVSAHTRLQNYDITMMAQGFADNPQVKFTSVPPLPDQDVVSLLALGITTTSLDKNVNSQEQAAQSSYQIAAGILSQNPLNKQIEQTFGWNIQLSSSFDDTKNIAVPKISLSKKLNPKLNATINRNLGTDTSVDAKLQYILNPTLSVSGNWEKKENQDTTSVTNPNNVQNKSIFGVDLEYKKEFK